MRKLDKLGPILFPALLLAACASVGDGPPPPDPNVLTVLVPGMDIAGYTVHEVADLQNHPDAGEPWYIYLDYQEDAVRLPGPTFAALDEQDLATLFVEQEVTRRELRLGR